MRSHSGIILVFAFVVTACTSAASTPTVQPTPTSAPPIISLPTATSTMAVLPDDFSHILYGGKVFQTTSFILLGGVNKDGWLTPEQSLSRYSGEATYSLHDMEHGGQYFIWGGVPEYSVTCREYFVHTDADLEEAGLVGTVDGWDVAKREMTELSAEADFYQHVVTDWLASAGVTAPKIESLQIFRVDIEGDGTDEVFISASRLDGSQHTTRAGDHAVVLMRKVSGNDTHTRLVVGDVYRSLEPETTFPRTYTLANFIDLNRDGVLEVVVEVRGWEKFGAIIFEISGEDVFQALRAECR